MSDPVFVGEPWVYRDAEFTARLVAAKSARVTAFRSIPPRVPAPILMRDDGAIVSVGDTVHAEDRLFAVLNYRGIGACIRDRVAPAMLPHSTSDGWERAR